MKKVLFIALILCVLPISSNAQKAEKVFNEAAVYYDSGNHHKAIPLFEKCIEKKYYCDGDIFAWINESYKAIGDSSKGLEYVAKGHELFPQNINLLFELSVHYLSNEDYKTALKYADSAIATDQSHAQFYLIKGRCHMSLGEDSKGISAFKNCAKADPTYEWGYVDIAIYYYNKCVEFGDINDNNRFDIEDTMLSSYEAAEKAFNLTKEINVKMQMAEMLQGLSYELKHCDDSYEEKYEYYKKYFEAGGMM